MPRVLREKILSLLSDQLRQMFDNLYWARIIGRNKLVSSTVYKSYTIMCSTLQSHEVMVEFPKHEMKRHPYTKSIFVCFIITSNIYEPLQEIYQMKIDIKVLSTKSYCHHGRLNKIKE